MTNIDTLIRDLEGATEGSRELDERVLVAGKGSHIRDPNLRGGWLVPYYTTSLDAALTLVPERHSWAIGHGENGVGEVVTFASVGRENCEPSPHDAPAATPALALCIAALKARSAA